MSLAYPLPWPFETEVFHIDGEIHIAPEVLPCLCGPFDISEACRPAVSCHSEMESTQGME